MRCAMRSIRARNTPMAEPLLQVRGLSVSFAGKPVVEQVEFDVAAGEKLALVGESGSGKTVTALSLLRLLLGARIGGQALFAGGGPPRDLLQLSGRELRAVRGAEVAVIFQEPMTALNPLFPVGDQIAEVMELHQRLDRATAWRQAVALLDQTGITEPARRAHSFPHQLSGGQRQRAMIAMALACRPKLLIADEPTTALDVTVRQQILDLLAGLQREHGMAVLMITHDLPLVRRFADRVAVMRHGRLVEQGPVARVFEAPAHAYTRSLLASRPRRDVVEEPVPAPPLLRAQRLQVSYPVPRPGLAGWFRKGAFLAVKGADFAVLPGRTLGIIGESGSGKSTLALAALGLLPFDGALAIDGRHWQGRLSADRGLRRVVQVVFQDPFSSLSPRLTVDEIVGEGLTVHEPALTEGQRRERVVATLDSVGLTEERFPGLLQRYPHEFSGGQRQRLAIARALIVQPRLLVLDEPTSALDVTVQRQVLELLQRLQRERGLAYLLITHDVDVIRAMAHEVLVMKDGAVVEQGAIEQVLQRPAHDYTRRLIESAA
jgi:microcin C transport system ATP-binding protein